VAAASASIADPVFFRDPPLDDEQDAEKADLMLDLPEEDEALCGIPEAIQDP